MTEIQNLTNCRRTLRTRLTKIRKYICNTFDIESDSIDNILIRNDRIEEIWQKFDEVQSKLEELEPGKHDEVRDEVEEQNFSLKVKVKEYERMSTALAVELPDGSNSASNSTSRNIFWKS